MVWLGPPLLLPIVFLASHVGAAVDLTLLADLRRWEPHRFYLTCVSGEVGAGRGADAWGQALLLEKDDRIVRTPRPRPPPQLARNGSQRITLHGFSKPSDLVGVFSCVGGSGARRTSVLYVHNSPGAQLLPDKVTHTVNRGDTAVLSARVLKEKQTDVIWKSNGSYYYTLDWHEAQDGRFLLQLPNAQPAMSGIYSATYLEASPLGSAFFRLIVRGCGPGRWGPDCTKECPGCLHGGVCHDQDGECVCPPGFTGTRCEKACREGRFGQSCQEQCPSPSGCRGLTFCLPDPYGCSCGSGWRGSQCQEACAPGHFGADCSLQCQCQNGGTCDRFSGCVCPPGWHGVHCEKSDRIPQILDVASELEFNFGTMPRINCAAAGNPFPVPGNMELRKPDGTVLLSTKAIVEPDRTTAEFEVPSLALGDSGLWECRVSTSGGQDSRRFKVNVKVPPVPLTAPGLLAKQSRQLVVSPLVSYSGDGPITSVRLHYRPQDSTRAWSSIVVDPSENVTLMNLRPKTGYNVRVQLSRPGEGGEGAWGPPTLMTTDCPEPSLQPWLEGWHVEGPDRLRVSWSLPSVPGPLVGDGFLLRLWDGARRQERRENVSSPQARTTLLTGLTPGTHYQLDVRLYHCTLLGPASPPARVLLPLSGPPAPRHLHARALSDSEIQLTWQRPEAPAGPISKYIVEVQVAGSSGDPLWMDVDRPEETSTIVRGLNASTRYLFRVRASVQGPGDWSKMVEESTLGNGLQSQGPVQEIRAAKEGLDQQLILAVVGSMSATCLTILAALLTLVCIRRSCLHRRRTFTYQSGSGEETILQFSSGTLTLTRRPKPQPEPLSYPVLEWEDITFEDLIGEGNFGQVIRAMIKKDGLKMNAAIKMLKEYASENDHRDFAGELEVLCKLGHHPNIINLLGACENRGYLYIAIEYAPYGNLLDFLRKSRVLETDPVFAREHGTASTLSSRQLLRFASDAANGMQYLSEKQFIHRDLAARNVLVGENLASKIADFGLSRGEEVYVKKTMGRLPVRWMAIESLNYSVYTTKSDVWSFGVLLWEIVSLGGTPYCGMTCAELYEKLPQGYRMEQPRNCDDEVYELMRQCWRDRPYERPPFAQIALQLGRMLEARKAYVNMSLFENFTYAGIDATAEEA
ncbi:tyrosine-protein kinase receptor Tie-1 [Pipistrellus kuhlii]|uniref:tyrosine-protein kinase receptor Tie-1 n=1 Tax=Pipistrellus kuhlii TaxID=59472 RepID=UPI00174F421F|nr:tyrosine-protein kinase receptor Tie-1 [Pipistrellus kuhlii]XP_045440662.1 tyrosine-protein kinase receptor Tie-1 [Pipistrellus kuhlii]KAF6383910.1 tyrosine kinase with immunoglobulin like and EGF like domains 1 [Pipistrellus kuhlii]